MIVTVAGVWAGIAIYNAIDSYTGSGGIYIGSALKSRAEQGKIGAIWSKNKMF